MEVKLTLNELMYLLKPCGEFLVRDEFKAFVDAVAGTSTEKAPVLPAAVLPAAVLPAAVLPAAVLPAAVLPAAGIAPPTETVVTTSLGAADPMTMDTEGLKHDVRIHSATPQIVASTGKWRRRRNVTEGQYAAIKAEILGVKVDFGAVMTLGLEKGLDLAGINAISANYGYEQIVLASADPVALQMIYDVIKNVQ